MLLHELLVRVEQLLSTLVHLGKLRLAAGAAHLRLLGGDGVRITAVGVCENVLSHKYN